MTAKKNTAPVHADQEVTIDHDVDDFDIEAWMDGATQPSRSVAVYQKAGDRALFDELEQQYRKLNALQSQQNSDRLRDDTLSDDGNYTAQLMDIADRMQEVYDRMQSSILNVKVRGATSDEHQGAAEAAKASKQDTESQFVFELLSRVATHPANLSPEKWRLMRDRIGMKQFELVTEAMNDACGFSAGDGVMPGFSPSALANLATKHS